MDWTECPTLISARFGAFRASCLNVRCSDKIYFPRGNFVYAARMNLLPFKNLPVHKPRTFVPQAINLGDWAQIAPLFGQLEACAALAKTVADLERWLLDWSELSAALDEEASRRYIAMTCHTDNAEAEQAYLHFVEKIDPELKP